jgi:pyridoxal 5'-phosphate synthase pdxT subunit
MQIGILALQGAFIEHKAKLNALGIDAFYIKNKDDFKRHMDGMILPGGESTTMRRLLDTLDLYEDVKEKIHAGLPVFGTCAGMILLANEIENDLKKHFEAMPITVRRNAYGRQLGSFYTESLFNNMSIPMVFIRAPFVTQAHDDVKILSVVDGNIVACQYKNLLATAFHPELSDDLTVIKYFIEMIDQSKT